MNASLSSSGCIFFFAVVDVSMSCMDEKRKMKAKLTKISDLTFH